MEEISNLNYNKAYTFEKCVWSKNINKNKKHFVSYRVFGKT